MSMNLMASINSTSATFYVDLVPRTVHSSHENFHEIVAALKDKDIDRAVELLDTRKTLTKHIKGTKLQIVSDELLYDGEVLRSSLADRILAVIREGGDASPFINFMVNLFDNPSKRAVDELFDFLEASKLPLTEDGHFIAYKAVRANYKDIHSGTFDNSLGSICEMPRNKVDEDKNRTCSAGLHFAAYEYAKSFGRSDGHMMGIKINPKDVVAIPSDYNNQKGRCCRYEVVAELDAQVDSLKTKAIFGKKRNQPKTIGDLIAEQVEREKIKVGSKVRIVRDTVTATSPKFIAVMAAHQRANPEAVYKVTEVTAKGNFKLSGLVSLYAPEWLGKVADDEPVGYFDTNGIWHGDIKHFPTKTDGQYNVLRREVGPVPCLRPTRNASGSLTFKNYDSLTGKPYYFTVTQESVDEGRHIQRVN